MHQIGATLGLPPVGVKGRDGLPDSAHWPNRPEGHYPPPPPKRAKKAKPAPAGASGAGAGESDGDEDGAGVEAENEAHTARIRASHLLTSAIALLEGKKPKAAARKLAIARDLLRGAL